MYKICTLVGTRPELIKLSRVITELDTHFKHVLVHSGQNYDFELNKVFFKDLKIRKPDFFLNVKSNNLSKMIANIINKTDTILDKIKPDALLVYGDTNTSLGIISAKRRKIPIFHMEAGNRCFDQRVPEEINRKIADHLSDVNIVISEHARQNLISEGIDKQYIFKFGSCMKEILEFQSSDIFNSKILEKLNIKKNKYILASLHREENVDNLDTLKKIFSLFKKINQGFKIPIILSTHPRTEKQIKKLNKKFTNTKGIKIYRPFGFFDYCKLQINSFCTISDSGTIFEESSILNFPAITIRPSHERPEGIDGGAVVISSADNIDIINTINIARKIKFETEMKVSDYEKTNVAKKMVNLIESYISIINKKIWFKKG